MPKPKRKAPRPLEPRTGGFAWRPLVIAVACAVVYANSLAGPFVFDDRATVVDNTTIESLSAGVLEPPHESPVAGRPVVNLSFALNYAADGRDVGGYHAVNIAIHVLCALALFGIVRRTQPSRNAALAIALIWAVHPLATEAVNYVSQRTESLMAVFLVLTLYSAIRAAGESHRGRWTGAAVAACALGMGSKETMAVAPVLVALYDRVFLYASWREALRARARLYAGLAATWVIVAALVWSAPRNLSAGFTAHDADVFTYLLNQCVMITRYLWLTIWPRDLVLYYGWPLPLTPADVVLEGTLVIVLLAATAVALRRWPGIGFLGAWFFITLAPTSSIVPITTEVGAERRMYLALMAVVALGVLAWRRYVPSARAGAMALAVVSIALAAGTIARNEEYRSSLRLAETTHERWPTPGSRSMYGTELAAAGRLAEAERVLREAAAVHPPAAYYLATVLAAQNRHADAIDYFRAYIASQPRELDQVYQARGLLATSLGREARWEEFERELRGMLSDRPDDVKAMRALAPMLVSARRTGEAVDVYQRIVARDPRDAASFTGLGVALASEGRLDEAVPAFQRAVDLDPGNTNARRNLQRALELRGAR